MKRQLARQPELLTFTMSNHPHASTCSVSCKFSNRKDHNSKL